MENHNFQWENSLEMAIFNSYVSLPEGILSLISLNHPAIGVPPFMETPT